MQTQYSLLGYWIDIYIYDYENAIDSDKNGHNDINFNFEIKRQFILRHIKSIA